MALKRIERSPRRSAGSSGSGESTRPSPYRARVKSSLNSAEDTSEGNQMFCDQVDDLQKGQQPMPQNPAEIRRPERSESENALQKGLKGFQSAGIMRRYQRMQLQQRDAGVFGSQLLQDVYDESQQRSFSKDVSVRDENQLKRYQVDSTRARRADASLLNQLNRVQIKMDKLISFETTAKVRGIQSSKTLETMRSRPETRAASCNENASSKWHDMFDVPESRSMSLFRVVPGVVVRRFFGKHDALSQ